MPTSIEQSDEVYSAVFEKALILGIQNGVYELWWNVLVLDGYQPLAILLDESVIITQDSERRFQGDVRERRDFGNLWIEIKKGSSESHRYGEEQRCDKPTDHFKKNQSRLTLIWRQARAVQRVVDIRCIRIRF